MSLTDRVVEIAAGQLGLVHSEVSTANTPGDTPGWDSLATLRIVVAIEAEFGVEFTTEELMEIDSFGAIAELVRAKLALDRHHG